MGSLTNLLLRTLLNVSVSISNAVVKLHARQNATLMSKRIHIITAAGDWLSDLEVSNSIDISGLPSYQRMKDSEAVLSCGREQLMTFVHYKAGRRLQCCAGAQEVAKEDTASCQCLSIHGGAVYAEASP